MQDFPLLNLFFNTNFRNFFIFYQFNLHLINSCANLTAAFFITAFSKLQHFRLKLFAQNLQKDHLFWKQFMAILKSFKYLKFIFYFYNFFKFKFYISWLKFTSKIILIEFKTKLKIIFLQLKFDRFQINLRFNFFNPMFKKIFKRFEIIKV